MLEMQPRIHMGAELRLTHSHAPTGQARGISQGYGEPSIGPSCVLRVVQGCKCGAAGYYCIKHKRFHWRLMPETLD